MSRVLVSLIATLLSITISHVNAEPARIRISVDQTKIFPNVLWLLKQGKQHALSLPDGFRSEVGSLYTNIFTDDIDGDGIDEAVFQLEGGEVNQCFRAIKYSEDQEILTEIIFKNELCNYKKIANRIASSYRSGATWFEDYYEVQNGKASLLVSDQCVGCGEIKRVVFHKDGSRTRHLVSDSPAFENRVPVTALVTTEHAPIFSSPEQGFSIKGTLNRGDKVELIGYETYGVETWAELRTLGRSATTGWVRCGDLNACHGAL